MSSPACAFACGAAARLDDAFCEACADARYFLEIATDEDARTAVERARRAGVELAAIEAKVAEFIPPRGRLFTHRAVNAHRVRAANALAAPRILPDFGSCAPGSDPGTR